MYQRWIPSIKDDPQTGKFSDVGSGYFHGWGYEVHEDANSIAMESVAIVEDIDTGYVHKVDPNRMRFMEPVTREHSSVLDIKTSGGSAENYKLQESVYNLIIEGKPFDAINKMAATLEEIRKKISLL